MRGLSFSSVVLFVFFGTFLYPLPPPAFAGLDPPHDGTKFVTCISCHDLASSDPNHLPQLDHSPLPGDLDDTIANNLCWSCHKDINKVTEPFIISTTHSSEYVGTAYGHWSVECTVCHDQHVQEQNRAYGTDYGKYIRTRINLAEIAGLSKTGVRDVKFVGSNGPGSFADGVAPVNGICEVCHTQTSHWRNDGSLAGVGVHAGLAGSNCMKCHPHDKGFKVSCSSCHGFPPTVDLPRAGDGLVVFPSATGSLTAGAHSVHAAAGGYMFPCPTCHFNGMPETPTSGNEKIQLGFSGRAITGADATGLTYSGQTLLAPFSYEATNNTTVAVDGSMTCASLYCHGNYSGSGLSAVPAWNNSVSGACGTCHGATNTTVPASGSHAVHAASTQNYACTLCHSGIVSGTGPTYTIADKARHVDQTVDWAFDSTDPRLQGGSELYTIASGTQLPTDGIGPNRAYGTCNNVYCHSSAQGLTDPTDPPVYAPPTWGSTFGNTVNTCNYSCHNAGGHIGTKGTILTSGSHPAHLQFKYDQISICQTCHYEAQFETCGLSNSCHQRSSNPSHVNHEVNVAFHPQFPLSATATSGSYTGSPIPGDAYGSCSALYCHSPGNKASAPYDPPNNGAISWGGSIIGDCADCHGGDKNSFQLIDSGSHSAHLGYIPTGSNYQFQTDCSVCHENTADDSRNYSSVPYISTYTMGQRYHADGHVSISFKNSVTGDSGTYDGQVQTDPVPIQRDPGSAFASCTNIYCHSIVQTASGGALTPDTTDYRTPTWGGASLTCASCHDSLPLSGSHNEHIAAGKHCLNCHYTALTPTSICTPCHNSHGEIFEVKTDLHVNNQVNVDIYTGYSASEGSYDGSLAPADGFSTCSNTYCHSNGTSVSTGSVPANISSAWGSGPLTCFACHAYGPDYPNNSPKANSHDRHVTTLGFTCNTCHATTTNDGLTISGSSHVNGQYDIAADASVLFMGVNVSFAYSYDPGGGTCSNISCHQSAGYTTPIIWGNTSISASPSWSAGSSCGEVNFTITPTTGTAPYTYYIDWGDGQSYEGTDGSHTHIYAGTTPASADYTVTWSVRDAAMNLVTNAPRTTNVTAFSGNILPTPQFTVSTNGLEVTLTDQSTDPDYNLCGHSGNGRVIIDWGPGGWVDYGYILNLTDSPSGQQFTHTYSTGGTYSIDYGLYDNVSVSPVYLNNTDVTVP